MDVVSTSAVSAGNDAAGNDAASNVASEYVAAGLTDEGTVKALPVIPTITLNDGNTIPQIGLGVLRIDDEGVVPVVESALDLGYRHIDGAAGYNNEAGVGRALAQAGWNGDAQSPAIQQLAQETGADAQTLAQQRRQNLWVTTKLKDSEQGYDSTLAAFDRQLALLQLEYVDMYMIHWPTPFNWRSGETWRAMQELRDQGRVRTLGVCNFMPSDLERLHDETGEWPAVNQIELHPTWQQREVVRFCKDHNIAVEAYSPMARGADLQAGDGVIERIAAAHNVSPAQVILRWHIENGTIIIPKSVHASRQAENLDLFNFSLTPEEYSAIDELDGPTRAGHDPATFSYA
ncbi:aldo/keto reductase [Bifidobacterium gallicum]|uniref:Oxidoreductase, aldo/keto reductase family protein n=1 Tax=Bifidobacterium gallicum DSM 20093 = LMG 11596 TaxID=561180 RepID=D1NWM2_9BIFI|nr:aldo/keto reductase [Bifidobacterium gallicum]EFA22181.1 oxidoreductase, aldo/keto reductase family protein [Bifidobacterium gallicum DSM 20093 = LMG 11596]KFI59079.1 putative 2,5-diketo-D-gluconic acid reductase [Bifidobacterium gallicum DSM 20093 = LMG 11596]